MRISASAPGKLVLMGEYAVLCGAPALVMAVNRRARVSIEPAGPVFSIDALAADSLHLEGPSLHDLGSSGAAGLIDAVVSSLTEQSILSQSALAPFRGVLDSRAFFSAGNEGRHLKLGLGSSAAITVAFGTAIAQHGGIEPLDDRRAWLNRLLVAHRAWQGGRGSGLDIAAAVQGGVIRYQLVADEQPRISAMHLPDELELAFVWTRRAASTREFLRAFDDWRHSRAEQAQAQLDLLGATAAEGVAAVAAGDPAAFVDAIGVFAGQLEALGGAIGLAVFSEEHQAIARAVRAAGAVYKPCGAGGGDIGVAASCDRDTMQRVKRALLEQGWQTAEVGMDRSGLKLQTEGV